MRLRELPERREGGLACAAWGVGRRTLRRRRAQGGRSRGPRPPPRGRGLRRGAPEDEPGRCCGFARSTIATSRSGTSAAGAAGPRQVRRRHHPAVAAGGRGGAPGRGLPAQASAAGDGRHAAGWPQAGIAGSSSIPRSSAKRANSAIEAAAGRTARETAQVRPNQCGWPRGRAGCRASPPCRRGAGLVGSVRRRGHPAVGGARWTPQRSSRPSNRSHVALSRTRQLPVEDRPVARSRAFQNRSLPVVFSGSATSRPVRESLPPVRFASHDR